MTSQNQPLIRKILLADIFSLILVVTICACYDGKFGVISSSLAGLAYFIPNALRTCRVFKYHGAKSAKAIVKSFYQSQILKLAVSIIIFAAIFALCRVKPLIFFGTYFGMQMLSLVLPVFNKL